MTIKDFASKPRDAATLIIVRNQCEVLLGVRSKKHVFMPNKYVFPGGRVDAGDARVSTQYSLPITVSNQLEKNCSKARARALAMAAIRETFEETGLIVGHPADKKIISKSTAWQPFFDNNVSPALDKLDYVARAITPPGRIRRFDARFFLADAKHITGSLKSNGELEDLRWVNFNETQHLDLSPITQLVLHLLEKRLRGEPVDNEGIPLYRQLHGKELIEFL